MKDCNCTAFEPPYRNSSLLYSNSSNLAADISVFQQISCEESQPEGEVPVDPAPEARSKVTRTKRQRTRLRAEAAKRERHLRIIPLRKEYVKSKLDLVHIQMMERVHGLLPKSVAEPGSRQTPQSQSGPEVASSAEPSLRQTPQSRSGPEVASRIGVRNVDSDEHPSGHPQSPLKHSWEGGASNSQILEFANYQTT